MTDVLVIPPARAPVRQNRALRSFLRNPAGSISLVFLLIVAALAIAAPYLYPEDPLSMVARPSESVPCGSAGFCPGHRNGCATIDSGSSG